MEEISKQIRELEKQAKEAEYWKERYNELKLKVENLINEVGVSRIIKSTKSYTPHGKFIEIIEDFYLKLKKEEIMEVRNTDISNVLEEKGLNPNQRGNVYQISRLLRQKDGIQQRYEGKCIVMFYFKPEEQETKELLKALPKKMSYMG